jgi:hypothetical protein
MNYLLALACIGKWWWRRRRRKRRAGELVGWNRMAQGFETGASLIKLFAMS